MNTKYERRIVKICVAPKDVPIFEQGVTFIEIADESGGEFVEVSQHHDEGKAAVKINPDEWPIIRDAIDEMVLKCREEK